MYYLIDTSVWIFAFGKRPLPPIQRRVQELVEEGKAATCPPVVFEILRGIADPAQAQSLAEYLQSLHAFPVDWLGAASWSAQSPVRALAAKSMDLLIAHTALVHELTVVHADTDFDRLAGATALQVESHVRHAQERR